MNVGVKVGRNWGVHLAVALFVLVGCGVQKAATDAAAPSCARTNQGATVGIQLADGVERSCNTQTIDGGPSTPATQTFTGKITGGDQHSLVVDDCEAGQACVPNGARIDVDAPDLDLTTVPRVWVQVRFQLSRFFACQQSLEITTADPMDGSSSPEPAGRLLLAVADGGGPLDGAPYGAERVPLGCHSEKGCGSPAPDEYAFDFRLPANATSPERAYMGQTVSWQVGPRSYQARNLRSYQTATCDDYWNFAYTIVSAMP